MVEDRRPEPETTPFKCNVCGKVLRFKNFEDFRRHQDNCNGERKGRREKWKGRKQRRESTDVEDLFIAHISGMDTLARGLRNAAKLIEDGSLAELVRKRYQSFDTEIGAQIEAGKGDFEMFEKKAMEWGEPKVASAKQKPKNIISRKEVAIGVSEMKDEETKAKAINVVEELKGVNSVEADLKSQRLMARGRFSDEDQDRMVCELWEKMGGKVVNLSVRYGI